MNRTFSLALGFNKGGSPTSDMFNPGESDTTLQNGDQWFYDAKGGIRTLAGGTN
jgi:hypothetical protein